MHDGLVPVTKITFSQWKKNSQIPVPNLTRRAPVQLTYSVNQTFSEPSHQKVDL